MALTPGKKAARTRARKQTAQRAAVTKKRRAAGRKAAIKGKRKAAGRKAADTRKRRRAANAGTGKSNRGRRPAVRAKPQKKTDLPGQIAREPAQVPLEGFEGVEETVLTVGAEGGSVSVVSLQTADGRVTFIVKGDESTLADLFDDEDLQEADLRSDSLAVASFAEALSLLDRYPWHRLYPLHVHPARREAILKAVEERGGQKEVSRWLEELNRRSRA